MHIYDSGVRWGIINCDWEGSTPLNSPILRALEGTQPDQIVRKQMTHELPTDYPYTISKCSLQNFRNPVRRCCHSCAICPLIEIRCFAESTTLKQRYPVMLQHPKQFFNCKTKNVIYLVILCTAPGCRVKYVGYATRCFSSRVSEHLNDGPMINHIKTRKSRIQKN